MATQSPLSRVRLAKFRRSLPAGVLAIALLTATVWSWQHEGTALSVRPESAGDTNAQVAVVKRVIDGDTVLLESGLRVRLLGIDTPETKHPDRPVEAGGAEAAVLLRSLVEGREVRLEFDKHRFDRHRRALAYVFLGDRFVNAELVRAGWSRAETRFPLRSTYKQRLRAAENEARAERRGLWQAEPGDEISRP